MIEQPKAKGGRRPGAGRKYGSKGKKTLARDAGKAQALQRLEITAERTMLEIGRVAFAGRSTMWRDGRLLPFEEWPSDALALLEGFEVVIKNAAAGDGHTDTVHKVHLAKKLGALDLLAKHFGLVTDKHDVTVGVSDTLMAVVDRIRAEQAKKEAK